MRTREEWMREYGIVGHGGREKNGNTVWALDIPDDPKVSVHMMVSVPNGQTFTWGGSNIPGTYKLVQEEAENDD